MEQITLSISEVFGWSIGVSALVAVAFGGLWSIWFNRFKEGKRAEFEKQIEKLKAKNDKLNYISKTQFDAEFKMYQELSEKSFLMLLYNELLFPRGIDYIPEDPDECQNLYKERYKTAKEALVEYQNLLYKFAPFISLDLYNMFEDLRKMGNEQIKWYPDFELGRMSADVVKELFDEKLNCSNRTKEMNDLHERIIVELRTYLNSLQIHED